MEYNEIKMTILRYQRNYSSSYLMSISKENLTLVLGLKVGWLRQQKQLSLKELSEKCGLSISYLNEIEKGKKYPKADKILALSHALGVAYDDLVSLQLDEQLAPLSEMLSTSIMQEIPFDLFGLNKSQVMELMTNKPAQFSSFVDTLVKIAHGRNIGVDDILMGALKSYREMNFNYFPEIEKAASEFRLSCKWKDKFDSLSQIKHHLTRNLGYKIDDKMLSEHPDLHRYRSLSFPKKPPVLYLNSRLSEEQQTFALLREVGYEYMGLAERVSGASVLYDATFDQLLNSMKASYFAGAVLLNEAEMVKLIKDGFSKDCFNPEFLLSIMDSFKVTPEILFYRISQLLKMHFDINQFYFSRTKMQLQTRRQKVTSELHFGRIHPMHSTGESEHYCRRWLSSKLLDSFVESDKDRIKLDAQHAVYHKTGERYFCVSAARRLNLSDTISCVTLGFLENDSVRKKIKFIDDTNVDLVEVHRNCEHCPIMECNERVFPPTAWQQSLEKDRVKLALEVLYAKS